MSKLRILALASIAAGAMLLVGTSAVSAAIVGSPHDLSAGPAAATYSVNTTTIGGTGQVCVVCHTPHNAEKGTVKQYIWNHTISSASYKMYNIDHPTDRGTFNTTGTTNGLDNNSLLCMSCHDGTLGLDAFGGTTTGGVWAQNQGTPGKAMTGDAVIGTDLGSMHPVGVIFGGWDGVTYTGSTYYNSPTTWTGAGYAGGKPSLVLVSGAKGAGGVYVVGCTTCHTPHTLNNGASAAFLNMDNSGSKLCLACHAE